MNPKNTKKSPIHENADANITCDFGDRDLSHLGVAYLTHAIHTGHSAVMLGFVQLLFYFQNSFILCDCFALLVDYHVGQ